MEAQNEATRDGALPIELIDGDHFCELLKQYGLGVRIVERVEEDVLVLTECFDIYSARLVRLRNKPACATP